MAVEVADFLVRFPAFEDVAPATVEAQLSDAWLSMSRASFANEVLYRRAVMLMAAHNLTTMGFGDSLESRIASQGVALDAIQSVSDGSVSVGIAKGQDTTSMYGSTSYGRELAKLLKASRVKFAVVGGGFGEDYNRSSDDGPSILGGNLASENW